MGRDENSNCQATAVEGEMASWRRVSSGAPAYRFLVYTQINDQIASAQMPRQRGLERRCGARPEPDDHFPERTAACETANAKCPSARERISFAYQ
jgi:hypothetical protein